MYEGYPLISKIQRELVDNGVLPAFLQKNHQKRGSICVAPKLHCSETCFIGSCSAQRHEEDAGSIDREPVGEQALNQY
jgi:hypothetical protein